MGLSVSESTLHPFFSQMTTRSTARAVRVQPSPATGAQSANTSAGSTPEVTSAAQKRQASTSRTGNAKKPKTVLSTVASQGHLPNVPVVSPSPFRTHSRMSITPHASSPADTPPSDNPRPTSTAPSFNASSQPAAVVDELERLTRLIADRDQQILEARQEAEAAQGE